MGKTGDVSVFWYFNPHSFQWVCGTEVQLNTCQPGGVLYSLPTDYWQDLDTQGQSAITLNLVSSNEAEVTCSKLPSSAPTAAPTDDDSSAVLHSVCTVFVLCLLT